MPLPAYLGGRWYHSPKLDVVPRVLGEELGYAWPGGIVVAHWFCPSVVVVVVGGKGHGGPGPYEVFLRPRPRPRMHWGELGEPILHVARRNALLFGALQPYYPAIPPPPPTFIVIGVQEVRTTFVRTGVARH